MMEDKEILELDTYKYKDVNKLLNEIVRKSETFIRYNGCFPKYLRLNVNQYYDIRGYKPELIKKVDYEGYFILGMRVIF